MSTRKTTLFYGILIAFASLVVGMVIASRLDLSPASFANDLRVPATNSAPLSGAIDAATFRNIAHDASPSVVSITVKITRPSDPQSLFGFSLPFGQGQGGQGRRGQTPAQPQLQEGAGSGFIIDKAGYILTNNHVVEDATSIQVHLSTMAEDDEGLPAKVIGRDALSDTALIQLTQLPKQPLPEAKFGDSDQMAPGDWVMAIGNPFRLSNTVTVGVVSAVGRFTQGDGSVRPEEMIQTDAAINRGNSGGPLLNIRGEVIGINSMIYTDGALGGGGNVGVGFAIPINTVRDLLPQLRTGKVSHGQIGVEINPRSISPDDYAAMGLPSSGGAEVRTVQDGPAKIAGMRAGDVIVDFNGHTVRTYNDLVRLVMGTVPGTTVPVKVIRDKKPMMLNVKIGELDVAKETAANAVPGTNSDFGLGLQDLAARDQRRLQLPSDRSGAIVTDVAAGSAAEAAGLQEDDIILAVQGQPVHNAAEATRALRAVPAGARARVIVWRDGRETLAIMRRQ